jgi:hypothetical protein
MATFEVEGTDETQSQANPLRESKNPLRESLAASGNGNGAMAPLADDANLFSKSKYKDEDERFAAMQERLQKEDREGGGLYGHANARQTLFVLLDESESSIYARVLSLTIMLLILGSSVTFIVESVVVAIEHGLYVDAESGAIETIDPVWSHRMHIFETFCIIVFTIEYVLKLLTCTERPSQDQRLWTYIIQPMNVIDVLSILPFWIELIIGGSSSMSVIRMLRMARIFRCAAAPIGHGSWVTKSCTRQRGSRARVRPRVRPGRLRTVTN